MEVAWSQLSSELAPSRSLISASRALSSASLPSAERRLDVLPAGARGLVARAVRVVVMGKRYVVRRSKAQRCEAAGDLQDRVFHVAAVGHQHAARVVGDAEV